MDFIKEYWPILSFLFNGVFAWVIWSASRQFVSQEKCGKNRAAICDRLSGLENKVTAVEKDVISIKEKLSNLPSKDDMHRLEVAISVMGGKIETTGAVLNRIERPLHLLMRHAFNPDESE